MILQGGDASALGPAELDNAVLDSLFRAVGVGAWDGLRRNLPGLDSRLTPDLDDDGIRVGRQIRIEVAVTIAGDELEIDLTGSDEQAAGPINCVRASTLADLGPPSMAGNSPKISPEPSSRKLTALPAVEACFLMAGLSAGCRCRSR